MCILSSVAQTHLSPPPHSSTFLEAEYKSEHKTNYMYRRVYHLALSLGPFSVTQTLNTHKLTHVHCLLERWSLERRLDTIYTTA